MAIAKTSRLGARRTLPSSPEREALEQIAARRRPVHLIEFGFGARSVGGAEGGPQISSAPRGRRVHRPRRRPRAQRHRGGWPASSMAATSPTSVAATGSPDDVASSTESGICSVSEDSAKMSKPP